MLTFSDFNAAVSDARRTVERADAVVGEMAEMITGRLRNANVSARILANLKRELRAFNLHTRCWKNR